MIKINITQWIYLDVSRVFTRYKKKMDAVYNGSYYNKEECLRRLNDIRREIYEEFHKPYDEKAIELNEIHYRRDRLVSALLSSVTPIAIRVALSRLQVYPYRGREFEGLIKRISTYIDKVRASPS